MANEGRALAERRLRELAERPDEELSAFVEEPVEEAVTAPSGSRYRVRIDGHRGLGSPTTIRTSP
jgi:hypothetical protein